jgi:hypothetical protein
MSTGRRQLEGKKLEVDYVFHSRFRQILEQACIDLESADMRLNMVLPCHISVYTDQGKTKIGLVKPAQMLTALSDNPSLMHISEEVESRTIQMVDQAK